jgi:hypothetical protein
VVWVCVRVGVVLRVCRSGHACAHTLVFFPDGPYPLLFGDLAGCRMQCSTGPRLPPFFCAPTPAAVVVALAFFFLAPGEGDISVACSLAINAASSRSISASSSWVRDVTRCDVM